MKNKFSLKSVLSLISKMDYIVVTASTVICSLLSFLYSIYAKKYIDPLEYGIFSTCTLIQSYLSYAQLGTMSSYNRDYPRLLGANELDKAERLRETTQTYIFSVYSVIVIVVSVFSSLSFLTIRGDNRYHLGYILISVVLLLDNIVSIGLSTTRIRGKYCYSAIAEFAKTGIAIVVGLFFIKLFGYYGLYLKLLISSATALILYSSYGLRPFRFKLDKQILKHSIKSGLPLMVSSLIYTIMSSIDKFIILFFMDTYTLGIYSVPILGFNTMVLIPQTISQLFYYKLSGYYGKTGSEKALVEKCNYYTKILSLCTSVVVVIAFYILPIFVKWIMPMYTDGIIPAQILMIGVAVYGATMLYGNIFSVLQWNKELINTSILLCCFNAILSTGAVVILEMNLSSVAIGTSISYALYSFVIVLILIRKTESSLKEIVSSGYLPFLLITTPCLLCYFVLPNNMLALIISLCVICMVMLFYLDKFKKEK